MKLCITSTGKDLGANIDPTFGRAPYFLIVDTESNELLEILKNTSATHGHGAGIAATQLVSDQGVDGVLTGYVGPNAFNAFQASGMKLFTGASCQDTVKEALGKFQSGGVYREATGPAEIPPCDPGRGRGVGHGKGRGRGRCQKD